MLTFYTFARLQTVSLCALDLTRGLPERGDPATRAAWPSGASLGRCAALAVTVLPPRAAICNWLYDKRQSDPTLRDTKPHSCSIQTETTSRPLTTGRSHAPRNPWSIEAK